MRMDYVVPSAYQSVPATHLHSSEIGMLHDHAYDPAHDEATSISIPWPPLIGPGSDKEAWVAFAREVAKGNEEAWEVVDEQAALIASLEAELAQLRVRLVELEPVALDPTTFEAVESEPAQRQPKVGRRKTSEATKEAILADLAAGLSQSQAAARNGVSAMTVSRLVRGV